MFLKKKEPYTDEKYTKAEICLANELVRLLSSKYTVTIGNGTITVSIPAVGLEWSRDIMGFDAEKRPESIHATINEGREKCKQEYEKIVDSLVKEKLKGGIRDEHTDRRS